MANPEARSLKFAAHELIDALPEDVTWEQLREAMEIRRQIERGLADSKAGRTVSNDEIRVRYGIS